MSQELISNERLTEMQRRFVEIYVANGGCAAAAARRAGYSVQSARRLAHELLNKPHVAAAVHAESLAAFVRLAPKALRVLNNVLSEDQPKKDEFLSPSRLANADTKARTAVQVFRDARNLGDKIVSNKPINEMTISELDELINRMEQRRGNMIDVTPTEVEMSELENAGA